MTPNRTMAQPLIDTHVLGICLLDGLLLFSRDLYSQVGAGSRRHHSTGIQRNLYRPNPIGLPQSGHWMRLDAISTATSQGSDRNTSHSYKAIASAKQIANPNGSRALQSNMYARRRFSYVIVKGQATYWTNEPTQGVIKPRHPLENDLGCSWLTVS